MQDKLTSDKSRQNHHIQDNDACPALLSRVIEMAWEDRTPFEAIHQQFGLNESAVIRLMRRQLKPASFRLWRARVHGRKTKHLQLRSPQVSRGYCPSQYKPR